MSEHQSTPQKNELEAESNVSPELLKTVEDGVKTFTQLSDQMRRAAPQIAQAKAAIKALADVGFGITGNGDDDERDSR